MSHSRKSRRVFNYESRHQPVLSRMAFAKRLAVSFLMAMAIVVVSLAIGMMGYHHFEPLTWIDAFVNASMILSGMGPVSQLQTEGGKIFAGIYALYSGFTLLVAAGLLVAPAIHRILHKFHIEND